MGFPERKDGGLWQALQQQNLADWVPEWKDSGLWQAL